MRNKWWIFLAMVFLAAVCVVGCGDDDDDDIVGSTAPATFTNGEVYIYDSDGLYYYTYTFIHGGADAVVDSIKVDTMTSVVYASYYWNYADPYWYSDFTEGEDPSAYESGDNITVSMYGGGLSSTCNISLLDYDDDAAEMISPAYGSYVDTGATVEATWYKIDNAEYYAVYVERYYDSSGTMTYDYYYTSTRDTTYTLPSRYTDTEVDYFYFYAMPVCGPNPSSYTGNWTGNLTTGVLYSYGEYDYTRVYVSADPPSKKLEAGNETDEAARITPREIMKEIYGVNR